MELKPADVLIVSIRGRGHSLAAELKRRGLEVVLIDLTHRMGMWPAEDQEGPFGFFKTDNFSGTLLESLQQEDPFQALERGFTFWTEQGPLELRGPTSRYQLQKLGWKEEWIQSLTNEKENFHFYDPKQGFGVLWPLAMAHVLAKTYDLKGVDGRLTDKKLPLAADFSVRFPTRQGFERSLDWVKQVGVQVYSKTEVLDLVREGSSRWNSRWEGFELKGEIAGIYRSSRFVWTLSSEETQFYSEKLFSRIYNNDSPKGQALEPQWCWVRYRGSLPAEPIVDVLPLHFVMIKDTDSPWTHDNLIITQRTSDRDQFDFWVKIPALQRFNKEYLTKMWSKIGERWVDRMDRLRPVLISFPQEAHYTHEELGPSPFPVFDRSAWQKARKKKVAKNARLYSPEQWESYSWGARYDVQQAIGQEFWNSWKQEQIRKEKNRDREIHPS